MILVLAFIVSLLPAAALVIWFFRYAKTDAEKQVYKKALIAGLICVFPVLLTSMIFNILIALTGLKASHPIVYLALYKMGVLALAEELVKFYVFRRGLVKNPFPHSRLSIMICMILVGLGFEVIESIPYAIGAGVPVMLIRGITAMHIVFAFVMGFFYTKGLVTGKKINYVLCFVIPWLWHALYDFTLSDELMAINDNIAVVPVALALLSLILFIYMVFFLRKAMKNPAYTETLPQYRNKGTV